VLITLIVAAVVIWGIVLSKKWLQLQNKVNKCGQCAYDLSNVAKLRRKYTKRNDVDEAIDAFNQYPYDLSGVAQLRRKHIKREEK